jgi:hypothetical protein
MMSMAQMALNNTIGFFWNFGDNMKVLFGWLYQNWSQMWTNMFASMRVTWNNISGWLADRILEAGGLFGLMNAEQVSQAKKARANATGAENAALSSGVKALPAMNLNTSTPFSGFTPPKYESQVTPIKDKENIDWEKMMGTGKDAAGSAGRGAASSDITAAARGSSEAEQRARAFMAGNRSVSTNDPKAKREARMERFLKDIERNTRQPTAIPVATIV